MACEEKREYMTNRQFQGPLSRSVLTTMHTLGSLERSLDAIWYVPCAWPAQVSNEVSNCATTNCAQTACVCTGTVTRTLRSAHVPTSGDPSWSPCLNIPWDRPARWQAIGTPPVPVGGLQMKTPALPPTTRKAAVLQTTVPESVNKSQRRLHAGLRTEI